MKKLLKIQQLMVHLGWHSRMEWRRKKRQPVGALHVLHQKRKKAEGDVDVDVDAGKGITSRCIQQQKGHKLEADLPKTIVQRCNYELSFPNPCLATGMPAWPAKSQFRTVLNDQKIQQALKEMLQKVAHSLQKAKKNPDADCQSPVFVSGILSHILKYYSALPIDRMRLRQTMTFFLDPNEMRRNNAKCQQTVGVQRKGDQLQQLIAVGSRRTGSSLGQGYEKDEHSEEMLLLWLTTLNPTDKRIFGTLAVRATDRPDSVMMATARTYGCLDWGALFDVLERPPKKRNELIAIQIQFH
ncbi:uncharacterized protein DMAD_01119 [Drosophila madeirensis]|uniref:Uncharacterized protein n=1 Tax=Drosophila madeirensis TaxID=30013 RepID=A0AAU9G011_DROMD